MASSSLRIRKKRPPLKDSLREKFEAMPIYQERGLNMLKIDKSSLQRINLFHWDNVVAATKRPINISIVQEFYLDMCESLSPLEDPHSIYVRGELIPWSSQAIDEALKTPYLGTVPYAHFEDKWNLGRRESRVYHSEMALVELTQGQVEEWPLTLQDLTQCMRAWAKFIKSRVYPTTDATKITMEESLLLKALNDGEIIDWGRIIYEVSVEFARGIRPDMIALPFASLISSMCLDAGCEDSAADEYFPATQVTRGLTPVGFHYVSSPEREVVVIIN